MINRIQTEIANHTSEATNKKKYDPNIRRLQIPSEMLENLRKSLSA